MVDFKFNLGQQYDVSNRNNNAIVSYIMTWKKKEEVGLLYLSLIDLENCVRCEFPQRQTSKQLDRTEKEGPG